MIEIIASILSFLFGGFNFHNYKANIDKSPIRALIYFSKAVGGYFALLWLISAGFVIYGLILNWRLNLILLIVGLFMARVTAPIILYIFVYPLFRIFSRQIKKAEKKELAELKEEQ